MPERYWTMPHGSGSTNWESEADLNRSLLAYDLHEKEPVPLTTRLPRDLFFEIKVRAIRSTLQILAEHAYLLYLGGRLPPRLWAGYGWPEEFARDPAPAYLSSKPRGFTVRLPRALVRWARVFAVEAEISDQELATRVFDWYVRTNHIPPTKESVRRDERGFIMTEEPLLGLEFNRPSMAQTLKALDILVDHHNRFGGLLADRDSEGTASVRLAPRPGRRANARDPVPRSSKRANRGARR